MNYKVKEFFNSLYSKEEKEKARQRPKRRVNRTAGLKPYVNFNVAPINDFTHFIDCEVSPAICPMQWEDLEIDFSFSDRRYCQYCDKFVYKVDNEFMIRKMQDEDKCMAISNDLLEKMNGKMDDDQYKNLQDRLLISMLFLEYKYYNPDIFQKIEDDNSSQESILKNIILNILKLYDFSKTIKMYAEKGVDLEIVLHQVLSNINDDEFVNQVEEILDSLITKKKN